MFCALSLCRRARLGEGEWKAGLARRGDLSTAATSDPDEDAPSPGLLPPGIDLRARRTRERISSAVRCSGGSSGTHNLALEVAALALAPALRAVAPLVLLDRDLDFGALGVRLGRAQAGAAGRLRVDEAQLLLLGRGRSRRGRTEQVQLAQGEGRRTSGCWEGMAAVDLGVTSEVSLWRSRRRTTAGGTRRT